MTSIAAMPASSSASVYQYSTYRHTADQSQVMQDNYNSSVVLSPPQDRRSMTEEDQKPAASSDALALEKKRKNASAQAAFRARRSTYISNLEETVMSLENVVRRLQDACRDAHDDIAQIREENVRLRGLVDGFKQREGIWKAYAKATAETSTGSLSDGSSHAQLYANDGSFYGENGTYAFGRDGHYQRDSDLDAMTHHQTGYSSSSNMSMFPGRLEIDSSSSSSSGPKHSPTSSIPPTPTSVALDVPYGGQMNLFSGNGKPSYVGGFAMDNAAIHSPDFSTYHLSSSMNLSNGVESHHRRNLSAPDSGTLDLTLYTTDEASSHVISNPESSPLSSLPATRSTTRTRRSTQPSFPTPLSPPPRASARLLKSSSVASAASSANGMSNTLAVIKAQAFGNVRKTRARAKKNGMSNPGDAAKAALEVLEARGLGLGLDIAGGVKRRRRGDYGGSGSSEDPEDN